MAIYKEVYKKIYGGDDAQAGSGSGTGSTPTQPTQPTQPSAELTAAAAKVVDKTLGAPVKQNATISAVNSTDLADIQTGGLTAVVSPENLDTSTIGTGLTSDITVTITDGKGGSIDATATITYSVEA